MPSGPRLPEPAPLIEEKLGHVEVLAVARDAVELAQADLDLLMSRRVGPLARAEDGADVVRVLRGDVEERLVAGDLVMSHGRLEQMPHAVLFVHVFLVRPSLLGLPLGHGVERVQVAVFPLGGGHHGDQLVQVQPHHGVRMDLERVRGPLHDLVDVGIVEIDPLVLALPDAGRLLEVADPAGLLAFLEAVGNRHELVGRSRAVQKPSSTCT